MSGPPNGIFWIRACIHYQEKSLWYTEGHSQHGGRAFSILVAPVHKKFDNGIFNKKKPYFSVRKRLQRQIYSYIRSVHVQFFLDTTRAVPMWHIKDVNHISIHLAERILKEIFTMMLRNVLTSQSRDSIFICKPV